MMRATTTRSRRSGARRARLSAVAAVVGVLSVLGTGAAWAAWTVSDSASSNAAAATVGVTSSMAPASGLTVTYTSSVRGAATVVTVTNTSSREGTYSLAVSATGASAMRGAITTEIGTAAGCAAGTSPASPVSGTLSAAVTRTGALAAGQSTTLCVRTSMTSAGVAANAGSTVSGSIVASVTVGTWTTSATALTFAQSIAASTGPALESGARYNILNANQCVASVQSSLVRNADCDFNRLGQFRITSTGSGTYYVSAAMNAAQQPTAPRWYLASASGGVTTATPAAVATQQWRIVARADGLFRFENVQHGTCAQVGTTQLWTSSGGYLINGAPCNDALASQGFSFTLVAPPALPPVTLTCTGNGTDFIQVGWPVLSGYQAEVTYRFLVGETVVATYTNGYHPQANLYRADFPSSIPSGPHSLVLQQSVAGDPWKLVGSRSIVLTTSNPRNLQCG